MQDDTYNNSFLVRDNLSDIGNNSQSPYWISPDIICYGTNVLSVNNAAQQYSTDMNQAFVNGQANNFYIRAKNITASSATGTVMLWYSPNSLFLTPQSWTPINFPTTTATFFDINNSGTILQGEVCLTTTPFTFSGVSAGGHFCLIAVASTNGIPFPVPASFPSNAAMALWVQSNPNVSQRNLDFPAAPANIVTLSSLLGNTNSSAAAFMIAVTPLGNGNDYPIGTTVSAIITDSRLPGGQYLPPSQSWSASGVSFIGLTVPANVDGSPGNPLMGLSVTITLPNGSTFTGTKQIAVTYYQIPSSELTDELGDMELAATKKYLLPSAKKAGTVETASLIELGICTFTMVTN
jgi:hypothetical protein